MPIHQLFLRLDSNAQHKGMASERNSRGLATYVVLREEDLISSRKIKSRESCFKPGRD